MGNGAFGLRIAIMGDFHFGYERFYGDSFTQAGQALLKAQDEADLILIAGDIFDSRVPKPETVAKALDIFRKLKKKTIVIHGTHERRPQGFVNPVELLCRAGLAESSHAKHVFFEKDGERVAVYGLAGVPEEYAKAAIERLAPKPADGVFSIFMFHQNLKELMPVVEHGLMMEDLPEGFNLYIDGHIHKNQELKKGGMHLLIPGSTVLTQLRREEGAKGYYVYDTAARTAEFREISTRPFHFVRIIKGPLPLKDAALAALSGVDFSAFPIVRVELEGVFPREEVRLLADAYREKCHMFISGGNDGEVEGVEDAGSALGPDAPTIREKGLIILKEAAVRNGLAGLDVEALLESACEGDDEKAVSHFISSARQRGFEKAE